MPEGSRAGLWPGALIALAIFAAYAGSLHGEFVLDDDGSILHNPTIRRLWSLAEVLHPPRGGGVTVEGRPILNLSLALNYAAGGTAVTGYHLVNVAIHLAAALALFGILRRTFLACGEAWRKDTGPVAAASALVWGLHPLQTESVSYLSQRAESLMGFLFLASLYGAIRAAEDRRPLRWTALSVAAALLCAGTKEVAVALPPLVLLYDRAFLAGSFAGAWRKRWPLYLGLAASWLLLFWLVRSSGDRGGTIGTRAGVSSWDYALSQSRALFHYLRLCLWPAPLVFDYGSVFVPFSRAWPWALAVLALAAAAVWTAIRRPRIGFLGAWFFLILAPTSSFVGGTRQMWAEHRMYLPLAAVVAGSALMLRRYTGRSALVLGAVAVPLFFATAARNHTYREGLALWRDTVRQRPDNPWAQNSLGFLLAAQPGGQQEALGHFEAALRLKPDLAPAHYNLGVALAQRPEGRARALAEFETALRLTPNDAAAHVDTGILLSFYPDRQAEALAQLETGVRLDPEMAAAHFNLGALLAQRPESRARALAEFETALRLDPGNAAMRQTLRQFEQAGGN